MTDIREPKSITWLEKTLPKSTAAFNPDAEEVAKLAEEARLLEEELKKEFDGEIRKMSTAQGKILVKLIDRETGDTSYEIVQEFRGNITAFFWQSFSKMFGQDLKSSYDPNGEDKEIEDIVQLILVGAI